MAIGTCYLDKDVNRAAAILLDLWMGLAMQMVTVTADPVSEDNIATSVCLVTLVSPLMDAKVCVWIKFFFHKKI